MDGDFTCTFLLGGMRMYSPKISEDLIPVIFRVVLAQKMPMTKLVNHIIRDYLEKNHQAELSQINEEGVKYDRKSATGS